MLQVARFLRHNSYSWRRTLSFSQAEIATQRPNPWRIVSAICVQRLPTITKQKSELERAMAELKWKQAEERSVLSGWEMKEMERERNRQLSEERKTKDEDEDDDDDDGTISRRSTADEDEDEIRELELKEFESFRAASRETDADATNDRRSLERKLSETLYLLVKKPRDRNAWQMPQGGWERGETMKEAAMRELREECGDELSVRVLGNLPWLFYSYRFPREHLSPDGSLGAKVFMFKGIHVGGNVKLNKQELTDFVWVTRDEMKEYVNPKYFDVVTKIMPMSD